MNSNKVWGGGEKCHYETACYVDELGYSVMVVTNKNSDLYNKINVHPGIEVINTKIITNSSEIKQNIFIGNDRIIEDEKVMIMYNGVDLTHWPPLDYFSSNGEQKRVFSLGNAGRLVEQKGQEYLIRIAGLLKGRNIPFQLLIAGSGKLEKDLKSQCKRLGLEREVVFLDFAEDIREFLKGLDIYLSTSLHEGSSHVILEAMAAGKPVVAFDISSMPEMIDDEKSGYLIPFGDVDLFTEKIAHLWSHPAEMDQTGNLARKQVEERFDFHTNLQQLLQIIGNA